MRSPTDLYIDQVKKQLICSKKRKSEIMQQLSADVDAFASTLNGECTIDMLKEEFGTPQKAAEAALSFENVQKIRKSVNKKKAVICIVVAVCIAALLIILGYIAHDRKQKEKFENGFEVEVIYEHPVEGTPPPKPENARIY